MANFESTIGYENFEIDLSISFDPCGWFESDFDKDISSLLKSENQKTEEIH